MSLETLIQEQLDPYLIDIDAGSYYPKSFISELFKQHYISETDLKQNAQVVERVGQSCLTTGFCLWCQLAFSTYLRNADKPRFNQTLQQQLLSGEIMGATGLSNPMKSFSDLEKLNLTHSKQGDDLIVNGVLPAVSNLDDDHYFGAISQSTDQDSESPELVMFIAQANQPGISLAIKDNFLGVNGSGTYSVTFDHVHIDSSQIISTEGKAFAAKIRPTFIALQIPIALGSIRSSLDLIVPHSNAQNDLSYDINGFEEQYQTLHQRYYQIVTDHADTLDDYLLELIQFKKAAGYLLLEVNQASMVNGGSRAYAPTAPQARKLKEGFFFAALTPTLRHLSKLETELVH